MGLSLTGPGIMSNNNSDLETSKKGGRNLVGKISDGMCAYRSSLEI